MIKLFKNQKKRSFVVEIQWTSLKSLSQDFFIVTAKNREQVKRKVMAFFNIRHGQAIVKINEAQDWIK